MSLTDRPSSCLKLCRKCSHGVNFTNPLLQTANTLLHSIWHKRSLSILNLCPTTKLKALLQIKKCKSTGSKWAHKMLAKLILCVVPQFDFLWPEQQQKSKVCKKWINLSSIFVKFLRAWLFMSVRKALMWQTQQQTMDNELKNKS